MWTKQRSTIAIFWDLRWGITGARLPVFAIVRRDEVQAFFSRAHGSPSRTGRAEGAYDVFFRISGVDGLAAELRARGAEIVEGPQPASTASASL